MNKLKRLLFVLAIITVLSCAMSVSVTAATTILTGNATVYAGDTVTIPVKVSGNTGFVSGSIYVEYDDSVLTLTGVNDKTLISGAAHTTRFTSPYILSWENDIRTSNYTVNGTLAELVFTVSSFAEPGDYDITVSTPIHGILNSNGVEVDCSFSAGTITVLEEECSHDWSDWKKSSSTRHKRSCDLCGEVEYDSHDWDDGEVTEEATEDTTGVLTYTCDVCGSTKTEIIPELPSKDVAVTGISLNKNAISLFVGNTELLTATVNPANATNKSITWTSSDPSVATVTNGTVNGIKAGTATITVTTLDGGKKATCEVTVKDIGGSYEAYVYTEAKQTVAQGSQFTFKVYLAGTYDGYSFALVPPSGMSISGVTALSSGIYIDEQVDRWLVSVLGGLGKSNSAKEEIITVTMQVDSNAQIGSRELVLTNVMISNESGNKVSAIKYEYANVEITDHIPGDINGDGGFDYYDVSKLFAFYRGKATLDGAIDTDINGDGTFDYYDVSKLFAIYRGKATFE